MDHRGRARRRRADGALPGRYSGSVRTRDRIGDGETPSGTDGESGTMLWVVGGARRHGVRKQPAEVGGARYEVSAAGRERRQLGVTQRSPVQGDERLRRHAGFLGEYG